MTYSSTCGLCGVKVYAPDKEGLGFVKWEHDIFNHLWTVIVRTLKGQKV